MFLGVNMNLPLSQRNISGDFDLNSLYESALLEAEPTDIQQQIIELLKGERNVDTLRSICELMPVKKFESYEPDALVKRARWRVGRLENACESVFENEKFNVLEIGCGRGEMLSALMEKFEARCVGLDPVVCLVID